MRTFLIATRGSDLARWQAGWVRQAILRAHRDVEAELTVLSTRGDRVLDVAPDRIPGKGLFTKEVEEALLEGRARLAVHSLKDLPTESSPGLVIAAVLPREDPADGWVSRLGQALEDVPRGAKVMTGSLRRSAQLLHRRPDLTILPIRGNVPTRLRKFDESDADGLVLACAGLIRLGLGGRIARRLDPSEFLPACGQGALAVQCRQDDTEAREICRPLEDAASRACVTAERAFLAAMGGGCQAPIGAYATLVRGGRLHLIGMVASPDGSRRVVRSAEADAPGLAAAEELGRQVAAQVRAEGGPAP